MLSACGPPAAWSMRLLAVVALLLAEERITRLHEYTQSRQDYERICQSRAVFLGTVGLGGRRPPVLLQKVRAVLFDFCAPQNLKIEAVTASNLRFRAEASF